MINLVHVTAYYVVGLMVLSYQCFKYEEKSLSLSRPNPLFIALAVWIWPLAVMFSLIDWVIVRANEVKNDADRGE